MPDPKSTGRTVTRSPSAVAHPEAFGVPLRAACGPGCHEAHEHVRTDTRNTEHLHVHDASCGHDHAGESKSVAVAGCVGCESGHCSEHGHAEHAGESAPLAVAVSSHCAACESGSCSEHHSTEAHQHEEVTVAHVDHVAVKTEDQRAHQPEAPSAYHIHEAAAPHYQEEKISAPPNSRSEHKEEKHEPAELPEVPKKKIKMPVPPKEKKAPTPPAPVMKPPAIKTVQIPRPPAVKQAKPIRAPPKLETKKEVKPQPVADTRPAIAKTEAKKEEKPASRARRIARRIKVLGKRVRGGRLSLGRIRLWKRRTSA